MRRLGLALLTCLTLAACSTQRQTVGTVAGVAAGAVVAGPVGAVVGGAVGAVATAPGYCYYRNRWGRLRRGRC
jgi:osmotically inducible lipoprotein OsmB